MIPRVQIFKDNNEITLVGDFLEDGMSLDEVREYFLNWLESYPQENIESMELFYSTLDGRREKFQLH